MRFETYTYTLAAHYLPALINGDESGLDDDEAALLAAFTADLPAGHWDCDTEEHFARCEISGLHASVVDCRYYVPAAE